jgi:hypothetical protein
MKQFKLWFLSVGCVFSLFIMVPQKIFAADTQDEAFDQDEVLSDDIFDYSLIAAKKEKSDAESGDKAGNAKSEEPKKEGEGKEEPKGEESGKKTPPAKKGFSILSLMPLGIGQFANGEPLFGILFAGAQAAGGGLFLMSMTKIKTITAATNTEIEARNEQSTTITDVTEATDWYQGTVAYAEAQQVQINALKTQQNIGLGLMIGGYALSVIKGIVFPSEASPVGETKKKKKKKKAELERNSLEFSSLEDLQTSSWDWDFSPKIITLNNKPRYSLVMDVSWNF